jgi:hypothetical protein
VNIVVRKDRSRLRALGIAVVVSILGIIGFLIMRTGDRTPEATRHSTAEPTSTSDAPPQYAAPSASTNIAPRATIASNAPRAAQPWQASLQPSVVAATRVESLSAYQVQMENWSCEAVQCVSNLRIPLNTDVGRRRDISAAADILDVLQKKMAPSDIRVALRSVQPDSQGVAVSLEFSPNASSQGRFYTDAEIAAIRMESVQQGLKMQSQSTAH